MSLIDSIPYLIVKYGKTYTLTTTTKTDDYIDPLHPSMGKVTTVEDVDIDGYSSVYDKKLVSDSGVKITDIPLYVSGISISSGSTYKVTDGADTYTVVNFTKYCVGDIVVYYELQLRS